MKTSELTGAALDYAVAKCLGIVSDETPRYAGNTEYSFKPSTDWAQGGPIIEREMIDCSTYRSGWRAWSNVQTLPTSGYGPTLLIAAMRCYVALVLGEEVETSNMEKERIEIEFKTLSNIDKPRKKSISADDDDLLLKLPEVLKLVPMSRSHWSKGVVSGKFPAPVRLSSRCIAWRASTIRAFIANL